MSEQEYGEHVESLRAFLAEEREEIEAIMEGIGDTLPAILGDLKRTLEVVQPDDNPSKSHWVVAQCRMILKPFSIDEMRIKRYLAAKEDVTKFDMAAAKMEAALETDPSTL